VNNLFIYIAYIAGTLFVVMGTAFLFSNWVPASFGYMKIILGIVFILYGLYRIVMTYTKQKNSEKGEDRYE
jgi:predicted membrane protein